MTVVLHAIAWRGGPCGTSRSMEESLAALRARGVDARAWLAVASSLSSSQAAARLRRRGVPVAVRCADGPLSMAAIADLALALRRLGPRAVLHSHGERALLWGSLAARVARVPHVHTTRGLVGGDMAGGLRQSLVRRLVRGTGAVVADDEDAAVGLGNACVVGACLDAASLVAGLPPRDETRRRLGLGPARRAYLFLGRLSGRRGADLLGPILSALQRESVAATLLVAGSGDLAHGLSAIADVRLLGERDDAAALLAAADVVLMPSRCGGVPMVALEAAAVGTPVVAFGVAGLAGTGLAATVDQGDTAALVARAVGLLRDSVARARQVALARECLAEVASPVRHAGALSEVYERLRR